MSRYYEGYNKKEKRRAAPPPQPRREGGFGRALVRFLLKLLGIYLVFMVVVGVVMWALPVSFFAVEPEGAQLSLQAGLPSSRENILLLGVDALNEYGTQRSDTIIIASVGYDGLRLTSLMRDMRVSIPGHGLDKLNAAYAYGGPELVMRTVNENFQMNIMRYVVVDFLELAELVDALGGVNVSVTEAEMEQVNANIDMDGAVFSAAGYERTLLTQYGDNVRLNGLQALGYARIRKIDSDYQRTARQRKLLEAMVARGKENPVGLVRAAWKALRKIESSLSPAEIVSLGLKVLVGGEVRQFRLPVEGTFNDNGSSLIIRDLSANVQALYDFVYGEN